jgi:NTE family protein
MPYSKGGVKQSPGRSENTLGKALVISGGGCKGAYAVGAVTHLVADLRINFDIIAGTSTGSLIGPLIAANRLNVLRNMYTSVTTPQIINNKPFPDALAAQISIFNTSPLQNLISQFITKDVWNKIVSSGRLLIIATVDLNTGHTVYFYVAKDNTKFIAEDAFRLSSREELIKAMLASSNQPVFMPPIQVRNDSQNIYVDGGVRDYLPIDVVVNNGADEVYPICLIPDGSKFKEPDKMKDIISILFRTLDLFGDEICLNDIQVPQLKSKSMDYINKLVDYINSSREILKNNFGFDEGQLNQVFPATPESPFKNLKKFLFHPVIRPKVDLLDQLNIDHDLIFDPLKMATMMDMGRREANEILKEKPLPLIIA